ncbi:MAG: radical SAM protein [Planctomycetota bacterium]|nr:MAG: radical SAM protein [Planctomycetota bacterium]
MPVLAVAPFAARKAENSRRLRAELAARAIHLRALPEIVTLNSTDICNLRCVMCPRHLAQGKHRLDERVIAYVCDELFPTALKANLTTAGGEPLGVGFDWILERALRYEVRMDVVTNGQLLDRATYVRMRGALDHLNVSVDCADPATYERIRVGGSFDRLAANLHELRALREREPDDVLFSMSAIVMADNLPHLAGLVRFAAASGAGGLVLQRLRHEIKPTPEQEPTTRWSAAEIERHLCAAEDAARACGVNLYEFELGRPNVLVRAHRAKIPATLDGIGNCYFLTQSFSVMYTGEVYPCCKPTDYKLGDVHYESPLEIWNGARWKELRRAHWERRGTLFCSGCEYAPHLPARRNGAPTELVRSARRAVAHVRNAATRRTLERTREPIYAPLIARHHDLGEVPIRLADTPPQIARHESAREASALDRASGRLWSMCKGVLSCSSIEALRLERHWPLEIPSGRAELLAVCESGALLLSCQGSGTVLRIDVSGQQPSVVQVLQLSDERSWIAPASGASDGAGSLLLGEYGVHPGARCAWLHSSRDGGRTFARVPRIAAARHVHSVCWDAARQRYMATTGDVPGESRLYALARDSSRPRELVPAWAGFTALLPTAADVLCGSDLPAGNGFARLRFGISNALEWRAFPRDWDLQVRQLERAECGEWVALLRMDEDLDPERCRPAVLLRSSDQGLTWSEWSRFDPRDDVLPERFVTLPGPRLRIVTDATERTCLIEDPA